MVTLTLTDDQAQLLVDALDSHEYWQLSEESYRNSGHVLGPGSDDPDRAAAIRDTRKLLAKIEAAIRAAEATTKENPDA